MLQNLTDDKSTLVQVMAWCRQASSHYLNQCWPKSPTPYGITRLQWVKYVSSGSTRPVGPFMDWSPDGWDAYAHSLAWCQVGCRPPTVHRMMMELLVLHRGLHRGTIKLVMVQVSTTWALNTISQGSLLLLLLFNFAFCYIISLCPNHVETNLKATSFDKLDVVSLVAAKWYIYVWIQMKLFLSVCTIDVYVCTFLGNKISINQSRIWHCTVMVLIEHWLDLAQVRYGMCMVWEF